MVGQFLLSFLLQIAIIIPLLLFFMKERTKGNYLRILCIIVCYLANCVFHILPNILGFRIIDGDWNWDGKIYGIICGIVLYFFFRQQLRDNDFFTLKQNKEGLKPAIKVAVLITSLFILLGALGDNEFDVEALLFQASVPGIDEEILFRGVLLGMMCSALRNDGPTWRTPAIIINGILFGLVHALMFQDGGLAFNAVMFVWTGMIGYALAYITIKTRSIMVPMLTHNLCNFLNNLVSMIL